jgi:hypothetical protein
MRQNDLEQFKSWFTGYCRSFYTGNESDDRNIALKEEHTGRVRANILRLGEAAGLDCAGLLLAETIALFHDLGRFPQYRRFKTFKDSISANHAALGGEVLREERTLDKLPKDEQDIIFRGVGLHNVFTLPANLDGESTFYLKLVRDADKLDIWRVLLEFYRLPESERASAVSLGFPDLPGYSPEIIAAIRSGELVRLAWVKTLNDFKLLQLSWVYDLNFPESFLVLRERDFISALAATLPSCEEVRQAVHVVREFVASAAQEAKAT